MKDKKYVALINYVPTKTVNRDKKYDERLSFLFTSFHPLKEMEQVKPRLLNKKRGFIFAKICVEL